MGNERKFSLALVTGASSGIGAALCYLLADKSINLIISGRSQEKLADLANSLKAKVEIKIIPADLSNNEERIKLIEAIRLFGPDLVINNAGFGYYGDAIDDSIEHQLDILQVGGTAVLQVTLEAMKMMVAKKSKGVILNVSSAASFFVFPSFSVYASTKGFVTQMSQSLDMEMRHNGVRILVACPGMVDTNFRQRAGGKKDTLYTKMMSASFAAEELWWQIQKGKSFHIFNWKYRLCVFLSNFFPKQWLAHLLSAAIKVRQ